VLKQILRKHPREAVIKYFFFVLQAKLAACETADAWFVLKDKGWDGRSGAADSGGFPCSGSHQRTPEKRFRAWTRDHSAAALSILNQAACSKSEEGRAECEATKHSRIAGFSPCIPISMANTSSKSLSLSITLQEQEVASKEHGNISCT
jgi:hypothetical protein